MRPMVRTQPRSLMGFFTFSILAYIADEFILVIGGQVGEYGDSSYISDAATLISPDPAGAPVPECIRNLTDFPLRLYGGAGAAIGTMEGFKRLLRCNIYFRN